MAIKKEAPMAAIGSYDSVLPFQAIGIETMVITCENRESVPKIMSRYAADSYAILFVEEALYADFMDDAEKINESETLSVVPIPNQAGCLGIGVTCIRKCTERAVGMDIFSTK